MGPTGQWFPRASPHIKKGHNKYIYILCPTLPWHGKHKYDTSCFKKETPEERKGWKSLPRPLQSETAVAISGAMKDINTETDHSKHQGEPVTRLSRFAIVHSDHSSTWALEEVPSRWASKGNQLLAINPLVIFKFITITKGWGVISNMLTNPPSSQFQCFSAILHSWFLKPNQDICKWNYRLFPFLSG